MYNGYHLIPYLGLVAPALVLSVLTTLALLLAGDINKKIRALLINVFIAEIMVYVRLTITFLAFPIRQMFEIGDNVSANLCRLQSAVSMIEIVSKVGSITLYAVMVYIFIKYNINKVKWYVLAIPIASIWVIAIGLSLPIGLVRIDPATNVMVFDGFCVETYDPEQEFVAGGLPVLILLTLAVLLQGVLCGGTIIIIGILVLHFLKKNELSEGSKRAIAKNLLFVSVDALLSIFVFVVVRVIVFLAAPDPSNLDFHSRFTQGAVQDHINDLTLSLVSLYTPLVTIVLLKPVREAMKALVIKCCHLY